MRSVFKKIKSLISLAISVGIVAVFFYFFVTAEHKLTNPMILISKSPLGKGEVMFYAHGMQDSVTELIVTDGNSFEADAIHLGVVYNSAFHEVVWSADGSVVAMKCSYGKKPLFTHAYDFLDDKAIESVEDYFWGAPKDDAEAQKWILNSEKIESLIEQRGGPGVVLTSDVFWQKAEKVGYWQWRKLKKRMEALRLRQQTREDEK